MARSTQEVLQHHLDALAAQDIEAVVSDYADDASLIAPDVTVTGTVALRDFFTDILKAMPGIIDVLSIDRTEIVGEVAYIVWHVPGFASARYRHVPRARRSHRDPDLCHATGVATDPTIGVALPSTRRDRAASRSYLGNAGATYEQRGLLRVDDELPPSCVATSRSSHELWCLRQRGPAGSHWAVRRRTAVSADERVPLPIGCVCSSIATGSDATVSIQSDDVAIIHLAPGGSQRPRAVEMSRR